MAISTADNAAFAALARWLTIFAVGVFACSAVCSIISLHCLYADGSYQLIEVLKAGNFVAVAKNRNCASYVLQFPVVVALKLGVVNLRALQIAFGLGCFLPWPLVLLICRRLSPRHFWLAMLGCAVGYLNAAFMPVGEYSIAHAFFWPALFVILFVQPLTTFAAATLIFSSLILVCSYESLLFLGPPLAALALWRTFGGGEKKWSRVWLGLSAGLLVLSAIIAVDGIRHPQAPDNLGGFKQGLETMFLFPSWTIGWSFVWLFLLAVVCLDGRGFSRRFFKMELVLLATVMLVWGLWPVVAPDRLNTQLQYDYRAMQLFTPFGLLLVGCAVNLCPKWFAARQNYFVAFSASLLLAQSLWHISAVWQWHGFVGAWRSELATHSGPVALKDTTFGGQPIGHQAMNFDWNWANPDLSLMLAPNGRVKSIILPPSRAGWHPFDPLNPEALPKLQQYGLNYDDYIKSLMPAKSSSK